ncbi:hypothetical protein [Marinococcus halophilus]|uniref:hypothetical protein n=1 Tax=Marinococcus halophilus TaxID=1371 RepID=UPI001302F5F7|nr:hypothetical protein [Marinococcus halophilus]
MGKISTQSYTTSIQKEGTSLKKLLLWVLSGPLLASAVLGCTSEKDAPQTSDAEELAGQQEELSKDDVEEDPFPQPEPQRENSFSPTPAGQEAERIRGELLMNSAQIRLPARFPDQQARYVQGSVASNNSTTYSIQYHTNSGKPLAHVTAAQYLDAEEASREIEAFREGKNVDPASPGVKALQDGLSGHAQEGVDQYHYSGKQGPWLVSLSSSSSDNLNHTEVLRQIAEYLKHHPLPDSAEQGVVDIYYAPSRDDVTVDIRWREGKTVYAVRGSLPPVEALQLVNSMK